MWDFFIHRKSKNTFCGNTDLAPDPGALPVVFGPGQYQFQFIFATNNNVDGTLNGPGEVLQGSSDTNTPTVTLEDGTELVLHVSCSDRFHLWLEDSPNDTPLLRDDTNPMWGYGEKDDPTAASGHPRIWDLFIYKLGSDKQCGNPDFTIGEPSIDIDKSPDLQVLAGGGVVTFTITVTNDGDVDLTDTVVTDPVSPDCARDAGEVELLLNNDGAPVAVGSVFEVGESFTYTCNDEIAAGFTNTATAAAMWNGEPVEDSDDAVVQVAEIMITKTTLSDLPLVGGGVVSFQITVTNIGEVNLIDTAITDALVGDCAKDIATVMTLSNGKIAVGTLLKVGESFTYTCADEVAAGFTNVAEVTAQSQTGVGVSDSDDAPVTVVDPDITITKTVTSDQPLVNGGVVSFLIMVTNSGDVNLIDTAITDALVADCAKDIATVMTLSNGKTAVGTLLKVGESFSYTCADEVAGSFTNIAEATAQMQTGVGVSDSDDAPVSVVNPDITIDKAPDTQETGGAVIFTITVTNTGDVNLINTAVADVATPANQAVTDACSRSIAEVMALSNGKIAVGTLLKVGESFTYECELEVAESFDNTATATAWWEGVMVDDEETVSVTVN